MTPGRVPGPAAGGTPQRGDADRPSTPAPAGQGEAGDGSGAWRPTTRLAVGAATDRGLVRETNQDALLVAPERGLFAVADGMGGHAGGEVASALAVRRLGAATLDGPESLAAAVRDANRAVFEEAATRAELAGMGTTVTAVAVVPDGDRERVAVANVGDSRVYLFRDGGLTRLTDDHSLVEELVRQGRLTPAEAAVHPRRNILTRVVGTEPDVEVDTWTVDHRRGDRFLLCSDGLFNEVPEEVIAEVLARIPDAAGAARELVRLALEGGGRDNVTVVVVDVLDAGDDARARDASVATATGATTAGPHGPSRREPPPDPGTAPDGPGRDLRTDGDDHHEPGPRTGDGPGPTGRRARPRPHRMAAAGLVALTLAALVVGAVGFWARSGYRIRHDPAGGAVEIVQGRQVLWWRPTVEVRLTGAPARSPEEQGRRFRTLAAALSHLVQVTGPEPEGGAR